VDARRNPGEWSRIVAAFERSGSTHEEFCAHRRLNIGAFRQALYRTRRAASASSTPLAMVSVDVTPARAFATDAYATTGEIIITIADVALHVTPSTDVRYVASLVDALRSRC
jgi:hypothetical protein